MGSVSRERLGVASGLLALTRTVGQTTGIAVLGAFWENRVAVFSGGFLESGATHASSLAQVSGLTDTIFLVIVLIIIALLISIWALFGFYKSRKILSTLSK
jgi:hypothetical protein